MADPRLSTTTGQLVALLTLCQELQREISQAHADRDELVAELESLAQRVEESEAELGPVYESVEKANIQIRAIGRHNRTLERRLDRANSLAASAQDQLLAERAWVAEQARSVAASQSWRLGHRLVRMMRAVARRSDRGADGLTVIVRRMESGSRSLRAG
jgi:septal ring factor EnvC (AmiA/AmiB activator)